MLIVIIIDLSLIDKLDAENIVICYFNNNDEITMKVSDSEVYLTMFLYVWSRSHKRYENEIDNMMKER